MDMENHEFDFWLGEWNVYWGDKQGTNRIERILDGAVIQENFEGDGLIGISVSLFSKEDHRWHQTWVDNTGSYLDFVGEFADGKMILSRSGVVEGKTVRQRMVWYDIAPNAFLWNWERSDDEGTSWREMWKLEYKRKSNK
jgi:hypothetical protein